MIIGVDHVTLSCSDARASAEILRREGLEIKFVATDLPNSPVKRGFLSQYAPLHSIAWCSSKSGIAIELTEHSAPLRQGPTSYQVWLSREPLDSERSTSTDGTADGFQAAFACREPQLGIWPPFRAQFWVDADGAERDSPLSVRGILLRVASLERSTRFWTDLAGFKVVQRGEDLLGRPWVRLSFPSPVRAWRLDLALVQDPEHVETAMFDHAGFTSVCLLSTSARRDADRLAAGGVGAPVEFDLTVNDRPLHILLLPGPDREIVELIEFRQTGVK